MPDKSLTVLTYAASASLAAVALVYLFNPSYLLDVVPGTGSATDLRARHGRAVGLSNPANDCFINSVLQALAGLEGLQDYLTRELALRDADEQEDDGELAVYGYRPEKKANVDGSGAVDGAPGPGLESEWRTQARERKSRSLLYAEVTRGLKEMLEQLNDRSQMRKIISAAPFVRVLESAFATRVNRNQQDAQELLQVVAERMSEEYAAGKEARDRAKKEGLVLKKRKRPGTHIWGAEADKASVNGHDRPQTDGDLSTESQAESLTVAVPTTMVNGEAVPDGSESIDPTGGDQEEEEFPLQGQTKHQIECEHCHFVPSSKPTDFIMLTLSVPPKSSATLDDCLDQFSKPEFIDDYKCDKCRIVHAIETYEESIKRAKTEEDRTMLQIGLSKLKIALEKDPENPPQDVQLPDSKLAPARRIARSVKITSFPKILVVHLSRSSFSLTSSSSKNTAKVVFPEHLQLGSLMDRRKYRLLGLVTHKGTHHSGHYETFRRAYATPVSLLDLVDHADPIAVSARSPTPTASLTPRNPASPEPAASAGDADSDVEAEALETMSGKPSTSTRRSTTASPSLKSPHSRSASAHLLSTPTMAPSPRPSSPSTQTRTSTSTLQTPESALRRRSEDDSAAAQPMERAGSRQRMRERVEEVGRRKREKRLRRAVQRENQRWWRISDDKVRECRTADVLAMQKEAYLLFYEMES